MSYSQTIWTENAVIKMTMDHHHITQMEQMLYSNGKKKVLPEGTSSVRT